MESKNYATLIPSQPKHLLIKIMIFFGFLKLKTEVRRIERNDKKRTT